MEEIKFRGVTTNFVENKFVYGFYVKSIEYNTNKNKQTAHSIVDIEENSYFIDVNTLGQFIGSSDKNSLEIFEGDNVIITYGKWRENKIGLTRNGTVVFDKKTASFKISIDNSKLLVGFYDVNVVEVVGNIHF